MLTTFSEIAFLGLKSLSLCFCSLTVSLMKKNYMKKQSVIFATVTTVTSALVIRNLKAISSYISEKLKTVSIILMLKDYPD